MRHRHRPGCPILSCSARSVRSAVYSSTSGAATRWRLAAMQTWPALWNDPKLPTRAACSRSASSSTTSAELPPSSRCSRLRSGAASRATSRPAATDPVNPTTGMSGWVTSSRPVSPPPGSTCSRSAGSPASSSRRAKTTPPQTAVRGSGLSTTALPRASAGASARAARKGGALNGAITPTTPQVSGE
jgi:hypothetical protein